MNLIHKTNINIGMNNLIKEEKIIKKFKKCNLQKKSCILGIEN